MAWLASGVSILALLDSLGFVFPADEVLDVALTFSVDENIELATVADDLVYLTFFIELETRVKPIPTTIATRAPRRI